MNPAEFEAIAEEYDFEQYAEIVSGGKHAMFSITHAKNTESGHVYLWVEFGTNDSRRIVYVGKAGKTMKQRCSQHENGFRGTSKSKTGKRHSERIMKGIAAGKRYFVYARISERRTIVDETGISMCCVEELAFMKKFDQFDPLWNSSIRT